VRLRSGLNSKQCTTEHEYTDLAYIAPGSLDVNRIKRADAVLALRRLAAGGDVYFGERC
jgi:hypothetical protein